MERTYIRNEECQKFLNDLELLTKEEIIEAVSMFFDQTDMEATGNMNEPEDKYMVNEFGNTTKSFKNYGKSSSETQTVVIVYNV